MKNIFFNDLQILQKKSWTFYKSFKVSLSKLKLKNISDDLHQLNSKNVAKLLQKLSLKDCNRLNSEHYVSALILRADLSQDLQSDNNFFKKLQQFDSQHSLVCIYEKHCLKTAQQFLTKNKQWWVLNLYSEDVTLWIWLLDSSLTFVQDISVQTKKTLHEQDTDSAKYLDKNIYCQICISVLDRDTAWKNKWLVRLSAEKRHNVSHIKSSFLMYKVRDALTIWETDFKLASSNQIQLEVLEVSDLIFQLRTALSVLLSSLLTYVLSALILFLMCLVHDAIITIIQALAFTSQCSAIVNKSLCLMMLYSLCNVIRVFSALKVIQVLCVHYVSFTHDVHCMTATSSALNVHWTLRSLIMSNVHWTSESLIISNVC